MGRILGIDFGLRRLGVAISDAERSIASPVEVYERRSDAQDAAHFRRLVSEDRIECAVIGLPILNRGGEGSLAQQARSWGEWLARACGIHVVFRDERFSSREADDRMREVGLSPRRHRAKRDMFAAQIVLQDYLDAGCPTGDSAALPLGDEGMEPETK